METGRRCVICGRPLPPRHTKYCSPDCARIGANNLAREVTSQRPHPSPFHTITCPDCGREVTVPIKSKRCPACQAEADRRHDRECKQRQRLGKTRPIGSTDLCERCGKPYTVWSGLQKYCKECAPVAIAEADRAASVAWNREHYSSPEKRAEINAGKRRPTPNKAVCPVCGQSFTPSSTRGVYCSPECAAAARKTANAQYHQDNKPAIRERKRKWYRAKAAAMTDEERRAYQDAQNAVGRANYARRHGLVFDQTGLMSLREYADKIGAQYGTVMARIRSGRLIGAVRINGHWYVTGSAVAAQPKQEWVVCRQCGKEFARNSALRTAYCSDECRKAANAQHNRESAAKWYQKNRDRVLAKQTEKRPSLTDEEKRQRLREYNREYKRKQRERQKQQET